MFKADWRRWGVKKGEPSQLVELVVRGHRSILLSGVDENVRTLAGRSLTVAVLIDTATHITI
jgi:hypothetical protein